MKFLADENFPRSALIALRKAGWQVSSIAEDCPGSSDDRVLALCEAENLILLTFDKDFGDLVFRQRRFSAGGVVLFRVRPETADEAIALTLAVVGSGVLFQGCFCVVTRDRLRVRKIRTIDSDPGEPRLS